FILQLPKHRIPYLRPIQYFRRHSISCTGPAIDPCSGRSSDRFFKNFPIPHSEPHATLCFDRNKLSPTLPFSVTRAQTFPVAQLPTNAFTTSWCYTAGPNGSLVVSKS